MPILGRLTALVGASILLASRILFLGRLPGEISFQRNGFSFFFPVVTCVILSIVLAVALNVALRLFR